MTAAPMAPPTAAAAAALLVLLSLQLGSACKDHWLSSLDKQLDSAAQFESFQADLAALESIVCKKEGSCKLTGAFSRRSSKAEFVHKLLEADKAACASQCDEHEFQLIDSLTRSIYRRAASSPQGCLARIEPILADIRDRHAANCAAKQAQRLLEAFGRVDTAAYIKMYLLLLNVAWESTHYLDGGAFDPNSETLLSAWRVRRLLEESLLGEEDLHALLATIRQFAPRAEIKVLDDMKSKAALAKLNEWLGVLVRDCEQYVQLVDQPALMAQMDTLRAEASKEAKRPEWAKYHEIVAVNHLCKLTMRESDALAKALLKQVLDSV